MLGADMRERAAFRTIMQLGGSIYDLTDADVTNVKGAIDNAEAVVAEIIAFLKTTAKERAA